MEEALLSLVLLGLAAALSSVPISATIFILLSDNRRRSGLAFLVGTVLGTFVAVSLATVFSQALPGRTRRHDQLVGKLEVVVGVAMVLLGVIALVRRNRAAGRGRPGWLDSIGSFGFVPVLGIGLALSLRPKAVLLVGAAGLNISRADLRLDQNLVLLVVYTAIATSTVVVPVVSTILAPQRMEPRLLSAKQRIEAHSATVGAAITILVGAFVVTIGLR